VRSFAALAIAAIAAMLLQTAVFPAVPGLPVIPDLILVLAVYLGIRHRGVAGAAGACLLGYFLDTFSGTLLGVNAFALTTVYLVARLVSRRLWVEGGLPVVMVVFLAGCVRALVLVALAALVASRAPVWQHVLRYGFLEAALAAALAPAVFAVVAREKRVLGLS
jgi:rod shape-determining protein MreD